MQDFKKYTVPTYLWEQLSSIPQSFWNASMMSATWNAGSGSEICAETPVAPGIIPNHTTNCQNCANPSQLTGCQIRDSGYCTTFRAGSNVLGFANYIASGTRKDNAGPEMTGVSTSVTTNFSDLLFQQICRNCCSYKFVVTPVLLPSCIYSWARLELGSMLAFWFNPFFCGVACQLFSPRGGGCKQHPNWFLLEHRV